MDPVSRAIRDKESPVYNSTNWREIKDYLRLKGVTVEKATILNQLEKEKIGLVKFKNQGLQKISQASQPYVLRHRFFASLQADTCILSSKRKYKAKSPYILVVLCQLSRMMFLENPLSMKFVEQKKAWERIFTRINTVFPGATVSNVTTDSGIEFSQRLKLWFETMGIKLNNVKLRPFRLSRGAPAVESSIRRFRSNLEKEMLSKKTNELFTSILRRVEQRCNNQYLSSIRMSGLTALQHTPGYIAMQSETVKYQRRPYLRKAIESQHSIPKFAIVRIKKFQEKLFTSVRKESYGFLSPCFIVVNVLRDRLLPRYKLGNLFTLTLLPGTYTKDELVITNLSYIDACELEERHVIDIVKVKGNIIEYTIAASDRIFVAGKNLMYH